MAQIMCKHDVISRIGTNRDRRVVSLSNHLAFMICYLKFLIACMKHLFRHNLPGFA
jgi:hypothetical protein